MSKRVLILDDDYSNAEALALIMEQEGFLASHIQSAQFLFSSIEEFNPDILFLDIQLGQNDGRLICNEVKANQATKYLPIILISALLPIQIMQVESMEDGVITKPFDIDEVIALVHHILH